MTGEIVLILTRILLLIVSVVLIKWPTQVIAIIYGIAKSMSDMFRVDKYIDSKSNRAYKLSRENPEIFKTEFPWHVRTMRITGIIFLAMFVLSLCMTPPLK
jgi:hypothetical protein